MPVDHQTIVTAKPVAPLRTIGYPNLVVWCSNRVIDATCGRRLDGGITWSPAGQPFPGVDPSGALGSAIAGHLASDGDGRLFLPSAHCGFPEVSISDDSGLTWTEVTVNNMASPVARTSVATDSAGKVYYVWIDNQQRAFLSYSRDHGATWSAPTMVAPPGVTQANFPVVAAGDPGRVAISFPSTTETGATRAWNPTVTVSANVFAKKPVFVSATGNDPANPIHRGACEDRCDGIWDFIDVHISHAGQAWTSTSDDCVGNCIDSTGAPVAAHIGDGIAVRQIGGPKLRSAG